MTEEKQVGENMGCDIHIHAEVKIEGKWQHYDQPECDRDYALFERMAGVRGDVARAIAAPRGLPKNATAMTKWEANYRGSDGHSHSWISAKEIATLKEWWDREYPNAKYDAKWDQWLCGNSYSGFFKYPNERPRGVEDVRFIFWFDN